MWNSNCIDYKGTITERVDVEWIGDKYREDLYDLFVIRYDSDW